jgi:hypothetical protein
MTTREELMELVKDLPTDETWLGEFMKKLKEKDPVIYDHLIAAAKEKLTELKEKP